MATFIDPHYFAFKNNLGKVGVAAHPTDEDLLIATIYHHSKDTGDTEPEELEVSKSEVQAVYDATKADKAAIESMATVLGIELAK